MLFLSECNRAPNRVIHTGKANAACFGPREDASFGLSGSAIQYRKNSGATKRNISWLKKIFPSLVLYLTPVIKIIDKTAMVGMTIEKLYGLTFGPKIKL